MSGILAGLTKASYNQLKRDLKILSLSKSKKKELFQRVTWRIKDKAKKSVSRQQDPDGTPWKPRKVGKGKMLKHRAKFLNSKISNGNRATIGYKNKETSIISAEHQYGLDSKLKENKKATEEQKAKLLATKNDPCSDPQAKKLRDLGYQIRLKGGKKKRANLREIKTRLTKGQAGLLIRLLKNNHSDNRQKAVNGKIKMEKRTFLDENVQRNAEIMTQELDKILKP